MKGLANRPVLKAKNQGGAPKGNRNAFKTGAHTAEIRELFARVAAFKRRVKATFAAVDAQRAVSGR